MGKELRDIDKEFNDWTALNRCGCCGGSPVLPYYWKRGGNGFICERCAGNQWRKLKGSKLKEDIVLEGEIRLLREKLAASEEAREKAEAENKRLLNKIVVYDFHYQRGIKQKYTLEELATLFLVSESEHTAIRNYTEKMAKIKKLLKPHTFKLVCGLEALYLEEKKKLAECESQREHWNKLHELEFKRANKLHKTVEAVLHRLIDIHEEAGCMGEPCFLCELQEIIGDTKREPTSLDSPLKESKSPTSDGHKQGLKSPGSHGDSGRGGGE